MAKRKISGKVRLHPGKAPGVLGKDLTDAGIQFEVMTSQQAGAACGAFQEYVERGTVEHGGQESFDRAIGNARTRNNGEVDLWDRKDWSIDIGPVVAGSDAAYLWSTRKPARKPLATFI